MPYSCAGHRVPYFAAAKDPNPVNRLLSALGIFLINFDENKLPFIKVYSNSIGCHLLLVEVEFMVEMKVKMWSLDGHIRSHQGQIHFISEGYGYSFVR